MMTNDNSKSSNNFVCESCEYTTSRQSQYNRHLLTTKHKMMTTDSSKRSQVYLCKSCGKQYKHRQGLSFHKKKCTGNLLVENIKEENKIYFSIMPEGKDPDDYIKKNGKDGLLNLLKDKQIIQSYIWNYHLSKIDQKNPFEVSKFEKEIKKLCYSIQDATLKK